ncbi:MAG TPA: ATP-binding cassette domain-containing protein, partial [Methylomirabilota bacterium]
MADKLVLRRIAKTFVSEGRALPALLPVDMAVAEGEFVTIVGPSGCGKSTLFNIVAGLMPADPGGAIEIDGHPAATLLGRVGYMPQRDVLLPWRTVLDNAILGLEIQRVPAVEARRRAREVLHEFGLEGFEDFDPLALSGGMKQRVALLRTFLF